MTLASLAEYGAGLSFGAALYVSGVYSPAVISAQLQLTDFHMLKSFMTASAFSAIIVHIADRTKYARLQVMNPKNLGFFTYDGNVVGGVAIGMGMALTGACPGTILVQSGIRGIQSGPYALLGSLIGGLAYVVASPYMQRLKRSLQHQPESAIPSSSSLSPPAESRTVLLTSSRAESPTIHATFNLNPLTVLAAWEATCLIVLCMAAFFDPSRGQSQLAGLTSPIVGGLSIGAAQTASLILTRHAVGCSKAYQNVGRCMQCTLQSGGKIERSATKYLFKPSTIFAAGIVSASVWLSGSYTASVESARIRDWAVPAKAVFGGVLMSFGAGMAGGCTSGHGISGLVTFSFASFITVAAMFGSGIVTALMLS